jgi:hypothetical protein
MNVITPHPTPKGRSLFIRDFPLPRLITRGYVWAALPCDCNPFWAVNNKETNSWSDRFFSSWLLPSCRCFMVSLKVSVPSHGFPEMWSFARNVRWFHYPELCPVVVCQLCHPSFNEPHVMQKRTVNFVGHCGSLFSTHTDIELATASLIVVDENSVSV